MSTSTMDLQCRTDETVRTISVIIPTKNRAGDLRRALESVLTQTHRPDEIVIIDQSSVPVLDSKDIPIPAVYIHDPKLSGLTHARNVAMERARGDIWLFLDDDVILEPDFVKELLAGYSPGVAGVSGVITNYSRPGRMRRLFETVFVNGPFRDERQPVYWRANTGRAGIPQRVKELGGGLMSFRSECVRHMHFDTNLTGGCLAEDIDFCARLPRNSVLLITPNARLVHRRSEVGRVSAHWLDAHSQSSSYMRNRHWHRGLKDDASFAWLQVGYVVMAALGSLKRGSLAPFRAWRVGAARGKSLASRAVTPPTSSFPKQTTAHE